MIVEISKSSKNNNKYDAVIDGKKLLVSVILIMMILLHIKITKGSKDI